jgi:hypothetical protein
MPRMPHSGSYRSLRLAIEERVSAETARLNAVGVSPSGRCSPASFRGDRVVLRPSTPLHAGLESSLGMFHSRRRLERGRAWESHVGLGAAGRDERRIPSCIKAA